MNKKAAWILTGFLTAAIAGLLIFGLTRSPGKPQPSEISGSIPPASAPSGATSESPLPGQPGENEMRGVWVASVINLDYPSETGLSEKELMAEADKMLDTARQLGFNTVFLQVRPESDALYPSEIFPWSRYITGEQGKAPDGNFDPLAYFINGAHERGLELHAWINPLRVARKSSDKETLSGDNPAVLHPEWVKQSGELFLYDPGIPEVRTLIVDGISELCRKYDIDGIHYDDYFYPDSGIEDDDTYQTYGSGMELGDWRRDNITALIRETQNAVSETRPGCRFGVSPQAIWRNKKEDALGSETNGNSAYSAQYADTRLWVKQGLLDYIAPQIYWEIGHPNADYAILSEWWAETVRGTGVDLYIGQAAYLSDGISPREAWQGTGEIARQIRLNRTIPGIKGSLHFRYGVIAESRSLSRAFALLYRYSDPPVTHDSSVTMPTPPDDTLTLGRPSSDITVNDSYYYLVGASDPGSPLLLNGQKVENRTPEGYFSVYAPLEQGKNLFTFTQNGQSLTRIIQRGGGGSGTSSDPPAMENPAILDPFPSNFHEIRRPGVTVTLTCRAPIGAEVTVTVGTKTLSMSPARQSAPEGGLYETVYSASYTFPDMNGDGLQTLGFPRYTMTLDGETKTMEAPYTLKNCGLNAPLTAEIQKDGVMVYPGAKRSGGSCGELARGQSDRVVSVINAEWIGLSCGLWVPFSDAVLIEKEPESVSVTKAEYSPGQAWDTLFFKTAHSPASKAVWDGSKLTLTLYGSGEIPDCSLPKNSLFSSMAVEMRGRSAVITLFLRKGEQCDGYYVGTDSGGLTLYLKRHPVAAEGSRPLEGICIAVDAGHGGSDTGALGPLGREYAEKYINLYAALKLKESLESLGAQVLLTRGSDTDTAIEGRLDLSRSARPDLFISLHCNSMPTGTNSDSVRGLCMFYREKGSQEAAQFLYDNISGRLGLERRGCLEQNLYVCRGFWTPSVLLEMSFINNPWDYAFLSDNVRQNEFIRATALSIVDWFRM